MRSRNKDDTNPIRLEDQQRVCWMGSTTIIVATVNGASALHRSSECEVCEKTRFYAVSNGRTLHPIRYGDLINVTRRTQHLESFKAVIDIQRVIIRVAAMSGTLELPEDHDEDDNND